jgi:RNA polymerase sigma factor (sigma-70 family)
MHSPSDSSSKALEGLIASFADMVRAVAWRHRLSDTDVDEVMQEVRIRLWRSRGAGGEESEQIAASPASYVYRTAVSAALDLLRSRRTERARMTVPLEEDGLGIAGGAGADSETESSELADAVAGAIEMIPQSRRGVVRMYLAGYPREEIASMMGWSEAKTRNLLYRGLADLRERLTARGIGYES